MPKIDIEEMKLWTLLSSEDTDDWIEIEHELYKIITESFTLDRRISKGPYQKEVYHSGINTVKVVYEGDPKDGVEAILVRD